jgi:hypothetical protein
VVDRVGVSIHRTSNLLVRSAGGSQGLAFVSELGRRRDAIFLRFGVKK